MTALMPRTRLDPDAARMVRVRRGDVAAFAGLVERYWAAVVGRFVRPLGDSPSRPLERAELAGQVRGALAALAGRQRLALELQCEDRSYQEIARRLALSPEATKSLLYRARQQLKETLAPVVG